MVFYFKARPEAGDFTIFMGPDKFKNEELNKYGFPEDICVRMDKMSSAHVYIRLHKGFKVMNWIQRKIYLYNVTFGLYMLDWWERYLFNTLVIVLMWFVLYNGSRYVTEFCKRWGWHIEPDWQNSAAGIHGS
ncbi:coiled-coil domain-containing protein 25 [Quercus suber]|uniref:Coiled-coil domain-containing protein 25 n=2 Tax=Quercus suber TaxID=58331 RepID=A0AAW0JFN7_QUESU